MIRHYSVSDWLEVPVRDRDAATDGGDRVARTDADPDAPADPPADARP
jgi:hypothetical protein